MKNYPAKRDQLGLGLFEDTFRDFFRPWFAFDRESDVMKTDISEKDGNYVVEIDLPGFDKKDINIALEDGYLTVSAKKDESTEEKDSKGNYIRRERRTGSCSRSFYVGDRSEKDIAAAYDKGILTLTFPKEEPKQIENKKVIEIK